MTQMWLLSRYEGQRIPRHFPQTKLRTKSKREGKAVERDLDFFCFEWLLGAVFSTKAYSVQIKYEVIRNLMNIGESQM